MQSGSEAVPYFIKQGVTAIFSYNDMMAYGVLQYAKSNGLRLEKIWLWWGR